MDGLLHQVNGGVLAVLRHTQDAAETIVVALEHEFVGRPVPQVPDQFLPAADGASRDDDPHLGPEVGRRRMATDQVFRQLARGGRLGLELVDGSQTLAGTRQ